MRFSSKMDVFAMSSTAHVWVTEKILQTLQILPAVPIMKQNNFTMKKIIALFFHDNAAVLTIVHENNRMYNNMQKNNLTLFCPFRIDLWLSRELYFYLFVILLTFILSVFFSSFYYCFHPLWHKISKRNLPEIAYSLLNIRRYVMQTILYWLHWRCIPYPLPKARFYQ